MEADGGIIIIDEAKSQSVSLSSPIYEHNCLLGYVTDIWQKRNCRFFATCKLNPFVQNTKFTSIWLDDFLYFWIPQNFQKFLHLPIFRHIDDRLTDGTSGPIEPTNRNKEKLRPQNFRRNVSNFGTVRCAEEESAVQLKVQHRYVILKMIMYQLAS